MIGNTNAKKAVKLDAWYGLEWDTTITNPKPTRIGKLDLHVSLPLQSMMKRCVLQDNGSVAYYLHPNDSTKKENSDNAVLTGADGQVMVELPDMYVRFETEGNKRRCMISIYAIPGFKLWPKNYISAYEATVQRSTNKLASVVNNTADYRGGGNNAAWDADNRTLLGKPASSISLTNFRTYARNRGSSAWNCNTYMLHRKLFWLFAVEYGTFYSQDAFNAQTDASGYRQGGLGEGVTTLDGTKWNNFNGYNPFLQCGLTNSLGNRTGTIAYTMPMEYDASGPANYKGEYNAATAYAPGNYVSSGSLLYTCILASTGNALTNTTYFTAVTRKTVSVPSYRGVENPFGHLWKWTDGCKCMMQSVADGALSQFYVCTTPAGYNDNGITGYELRGLLPRTNGYIKEILMGDNGDIMPAAVGAGATTYFTDYFETNIPASGTAERGVLFGGSASSGAYAGFVYSNSPYTASSADAYIGSRLCFIPAV